MNSLNEQFIASSIATYLVKEGNYNVLNINEKSKEIWLEKYHNKATSIIRIVNRGFDWKNHLKQDIAMFFQKIKMMRKLFRGNIELHNLYISQHPPVDDWEVLKKPLKLKEKVPIIMNVYYLEESNMTEEMTRFQRMVDANETDELLNDYSDLEKEYAIQSNRKYLTKTLYDKRKEQKEVFTFGKPIFTYVLLLINILIFLLLELNGGSQNVSTLIKYGAKFNPLIMEGEWWRLVSAMFLHIGLLHLLMNMLAIYYLGVLIEKIYGSIRFLVIYFLAGIGGSLASFALTEHVSAGASGALFGMFGALLFFGLIYKDIFFQTMGKNVILLLLINVVFGFVVTQVDAWAHMGGLIGGFLAAAIVHLPRKGKPFTQFIAFILFFIFISLLTIYGVGNNQ